jgi:hypothetical protein
MTPVFSGGLVYEYSMERVPGGPNAFARHEFGLVEIKDNIVTELDDFRKVKSRFEKPLPTDDGGYKPSGKPSLCPPKGADWDPIPVDAAKAGVKVSAIPTMPQDAANYMKNGAGVGPGFKGVGSHDVTKMGGAKSFGWDPVSDSDGAGGSSTSATAPNSTQSKDSSVKKNGGAVVTSFSIGLLLFTTGLLAAIQL